MITDIVNTYNCRYNTKTCNTTWQTNNTCLHKRSHILTLMSHNTEPINPQYKTTEIQNLTSVGCRIGSLFSIPWKCWIVNKINPATQNKPRSDEIQHDRFLRTGRRESAARLLIFQITHTQILKTHIKSKIWNMTHQSKSKLQSDPSLNHENLEWLDLWRATKWVFIDWLSLKQSDVCARACVLCKIWTPSQVPKWFMRLLRGESQKGRQINEAVNSSTRESSSRGRENKQNMCMILYKLIY